MRAAILHREKPLLRIEHGQREIARAHGTALSRRNVLSRGNSNPLHAERPPFLERPWGEFRQTAWDGAGAARATRHTICLSISSDVRSIHGDLLRWRRPYPCAPSQCPGARRNRTSVPDSWRSRDSTERTVHKLPAPDRWSQPLPADRLCERLSPRRRPLPPASSLPGRPCQCLSRSLQRSCVDSLPPPSSLCAACRDSQGASQVPLPLPSNPARQSGKTDFQHKSSPCGRPWCTLGPTAYLNRPRSSADRIS